MNRRPVWAIALAVVILAAFVGFASYNAGVEHGVATSSSIAALQAQSPAPTTPAPFPPYGWHYYRPHPFGFFPPFLGLLFVFFIVRALLWGGPFRRHGYGHTWHHGPRGFDEWHRDAHERMKHDAPGDRA